MSNISDTLKHAKTSRNKFLNYWLEFKKYDIELLKRFMEYKVELQIGIMLEFLGRENIGVVGYNNNFDIFIINPDLLPIKDKELNEKKSHFIYDYRDGFVFIRDSRTYKYSGVNTVIDGYILAICTAINWLNYE